MSLETLPDELLLLVCSYLSAFDILQAFNDLNVRLNSTISDYRKRINLTRVRYGQINQYCDLLLRPHFGVQVRSLSLSGCVSITKQFTIFLERLCPLDVNLPNLEHFTLLDTTFHELGSFLPKITSLKKLTHLTITYKETYSDDDIRRKCFHELTKNFVSLKQISLHKTSTHRRHSIDQWNLLDLNGHEIIELIDDTLSLDIDAHHDHETDDRTPTESPTLVLPNHVFVNLRSIQVGAEDYMCFTKFLESFLKQLFCRAPNLKSIRISSNGDGTGIDDILDVLSCFDKPSLSIEKCTFEVKSHFDKGFMEQVIFHLPMLTSLTIRIYDDDEFVDIVNTCLTHLAHLLYLKLSSPCYYTQYFGPDEEEASINNGFQLWLKENTLLGSEMVGRPFCAKYDFDYKIWL